MPQAFAEDRQWVIGMPYQCQHANELCAALVLRYILEHVEQLGVVGGIALAVGIARRVDARRATEVIDCQARIVGQRRQARDACGIAGLEDGILDKRQAGFFGLHAAELTNRAQMYGLTEHGLEFFEFAGVMAGQHDLLEIHHSPGKTSWLKLKLLDLPSA
ncbi:hypothetical protein D9M71_301950 [compost metagenome]